MSAPTDSEADGGLAGPMDWSDAVLFGGGVVVGAHGIAINAPVPEPVIPTIVIFAASATVLLLLVTWLFAAATNLYRRGEVGV